MRRSDMSNDVSYGTDDVCAKSLGKGTRQAMEQADERTERTWECGIDAKMTQSESDMSNDRRDDGGRERYKASKGSGKNGANQESGTVTRTKEALETRAPRGNRARVKPETAAIAESKGTSE